MLSTILQPIPPAGAEHSARSRTAADLPAFDAVLDAPALDPCPTLADVDGIDIAAMSTDEPTLNEWDASGCAVPDSLPAFVLPSDDV